MTDEEKEEIYQEFKARLVDELTYTGQIMEPLRSLQDTEPN